MCPLHTLHAMHCSSLCVPVKERSASVCAHAMQQASQLQSGIRSGGMAGLAVVPYQ